MTQKNCVNLKAIMGLLALSIATASAAQDAEPFDPYAAYKKAQTQDQSVSELPAPLAPEESNTAPEIIAQESSEPVLSSAPHEGMSDQEVLEWMNALEAQSKAQALGDETTPVQSAVEAEPAAVELEGAPLDLDSLERLVEESRKKEPVSEPPAQSKAINAPTVPTQQENQAQSKDAAATSSLKTLREDIAPFYLTAKDYTAHRGSKFGPQMTLNYTVTSQGQSGEIAVQNIEILLGADYVVIAHDSNQKAAQKIYDFALNRLLTLTQSEGRIQMMNSSLYALIHRNVTTIRKMTSDGQSEKVQAGNSAMDAFWMESALSFTMNDRLEYLDVVEDGARSIIEFKDEVILDLTLDETSYPSRELSDTFLAYAHHGLPLHPSALRQLYAASSPPKTMNILVKGPNFPTGQRQIWTLNSSHISNGDFPLSTAAASVTEGEAVDPLAFVISQAAKGKALGGRPDASALAEAVNAAMRADDTLKAWLAAQRYIALMGPCDTPLHDSYKFVCTTLSKIQMRDDLPVELTRLIKAFSDAKTKDGRVAAVIALAPYADDPEASAVILKTLGLTRAKIRRATAKAAMIDHIDGQSLIMQALVRDPYDPGSYLGLAQIHAAQGQYEAAWDMYDAMRASLSRTANQHYTIDGVEDKLRNGAPGYFIP